MEITQRKKVLIITYYWPPSGGSGVQRWLKFVKYLRNFNYEPIIYTVENGEYPAIDYSLQKDIPESIEILKTKIWEPYNFYKKFTRQKHKKVKAGFLSDDKKESLAHKISVWIRGNFFIPDARSFWIKPSVKYLSAYLKQNPVDIIISSGPPHTCHIIAQKIHAATGIKWVADFRDPWTGIFYFKDLKLSASAIKKHYKLEREVLHEADQIIVAGNTMKKDFSALTKKPIHVITNGFDDEDYITLPVALDPKFSIAQIGMLMPSQNPSFLWATLRDIINENAEFEKYIELKFVGAIDRTAQDDLVKYNLEKYVNKLAYLPHEEVVKHQQSAQVLLLLINKVENADYLLTGKLFEYLAAARPILCIGPPSGDAAEIIQTTQAGYVINYDDSAALKKLLLQLFSSFTQHHLQIQATGIENYSRKNLTKILSSVLDTV